MRRTPPSRLNASVAARGATAEACVLAHCIAPQCVCDRHHRRASQDATAASLPFSTLTDNFEQPAVGQLTDSPADTDRNGEVQSDTAAAPLTLPLRLQGPLVHILQPNSTPYCNPAKKVECIPRLATAGVHRSRSRYPPLAALHFTHRRVPAASQKIVLRTVSGWQPRLQCNVLEPRALTNWDRDGNCNL